MMQWGNLSVSMLDAEYSMVDLAGFVQLSIQLAVLERNLWVWMSNQLHGANGTVSDYCMKGSLGLPLIADKN